MLNIILKVKDCTAIAEFSDYVTQEGNYETQCAVTIDGTKQSGYGYATCSLNDEYNATIGRNIALGRALVDYDETIGIEKATRHAILKEFNKFTKEFLQPNRPPKKPKKKQHNTVTITVDLFSNPMRPHHYLLAEC